MSHSRFSDKGRRYLNLRQDQVESVLPEHFQDYYPKFLALLNQYYIWQDKYASTELLSHLFNTRDISETDISLLSYIEDELLLGDTYFEGFGQTVAEKRAAANFSSTLFRAKGSKFAIEWFFRSFYGFDAEVIYPKENIFKTSEVDSQIGPDSLRFLTNDELYQTFAILIKVGVPISKWRDIFKKFAHPAGMYLGGEVLLTSDVISDILADDQDTKQRPTTTYALTADVDVSSASSVLFEGQTATFTLTGTNVVDGIDAVNWHIEHVTTDNDDFPSTIPLVGSKQPLDINSSTGTFQVQTWITDATVESDEVYLVKITDLEGRSLTELSVTVKNSVPTYTMTASTTSLSEGGNVTFTIEGTNVPYFGNTILRWYVSHTSTDNADFVPNPPPLSASSQDVVILDGAGTFGVRLSIDGASDSGESFDVILVDTVGTVVATQTITTVDVVSAYAVTVSDIVEGSQVEINIAVNASEIGDSFTYVITGGDARLSQTTDTFTITSNPFIRILDTTSSNAYEGSTTSTVTVTNNVTSVQVADTFVITDATSTFNLSATPSQAGEGSTVEFSLDGTNVPTQVYYWNLTHGSTVDADFTSPTGALDGSTRIASGTIGSGGSLGSLVFATDSEVSDETFTFNLYTNNTVPGTVVASLPFVIEGTGTSNAITLDKSTMTENNDSIVNTFTTSLADGEYYYYIDGSQNPIYDFVDGEFWNSGDRKPFNVFNGHGTYTITTLADLTFESSEVFVTKVSATATGAILATSPNITVTNTSSQSYTIASYGTLVEGDTIDLSVVSNGPAETVFVELTGDISQFSTTQSTALSTPEGIKIFSFPTTSTTTHSGTQNITATVARGNYVNSGGAQVAALAFTLVDQDPTGTLTPSNLSPSEGDTVTFDLTGSNISDGTYYYRDYAKVKPVRVSSGNTSGSSSITMSSTDLAKLQHGMKTLDLQVTGTITGIFSTNVTLSTPNARATTTGEILHFISPEDIEDTDNSSLYGSFTFASGSGSFEVDFATNADFSNDEHNFSVYSSNLPISSYEESLVATAPTVTVQDQTLFTIQFTDSALTDTGAGDIYLESVGTNSAAVSSTKFAMNRDGTIGNTTNQSSSPQTTETNDWINPPSSRFSTAGDQFQVRIRAWEDSARTIPCSAGDQDQNTASYQTAVWTLSGNLGATTWQPNSSNQWHRLSTNVLVELDGYRSGGGSENLTIYLTLEIKSYTGTLGSGTTYLTKNFTMRGGLNVTVNSR